MKIDITSMFFNSRIEGQTATPAWGTSIGQNKSRACRIDDFKSEVVDMVIGMTYKSVADIDKLDVSKGSGNRDIITCSVFEDVYINNKKIDNTQYVLLLVREHSKSHDGRLLISYAPYIKYNGIENQSCIELMQQLLGCSAEGCWFVYDISIKNQSELHFNAVVVNPSSPMVYSNSIKSKNRSEEWKALIPSEGESESDIKNCISDTLQQIFYGAPGTGKSHKVKSDEKVKIADEKNLVFRTTFHPDSDYSTFVGCYKPGMKSGDRIYSAEELAVKLKEIKDSGVTYPCHKFAAQYWRSLKDLSADAIKQILNACGFTESMNVEISKGVAIGQEYLNKDEDGKIVYTFTPQAFTNAYVKAWSTTEGVYLIIEEINRGNCAQIFGDLFQLLDRKKGISEYPIEADTDLRNYIAKELENSTRSDFPNGVKEGEKLILPSNLYIWATMNTSDQSLFPIDSAFKRRWDWKYMPIKNHEKEGYTIKINETIYDWWGFIDKINSVIDSMTHSEDKKLGYFFVKAEDKVVNAEQFVGKVLFYLWNDVFKNYGFDSPIFNKDEKEKFSFSDFFEIDGSPNTDMVMLFLKNIDEKIKPEKSIIITIGESDNPASLIIKYNGEEIDGASSRAKYIKVVEKILVEKDADQVANCIGADMTKTPAEESTRRYQIVGDSGWYLATNNSVETMRSKIQKLKDTFNLDLTFE